MKLQLGTGSLALTATLERRTPNSCPRVNLVLLARERACGGHFGCAYFHQRHVTTALLRNQ